MYNEYNNTSSARAMQPYKRVPKQVRVSDLANDSKKINEYLRFFEKNPNPSREQIQNHLKENDIWMSMLDNRINDCEHIIALNELAPADEELVHKAQEILSGTLGIRILLKRHRQECLYRMNNTKQPFDGIREYRVRTLKKEFGNVITIEDGKVVFHSDVEAC